MIGSPVRKIDDYVMHIFREHKQEADHKANLGTEAQKKITIEGVKRVQRSGKQHGVAGMVGVDVGL